MDKVHLIINGDPYWVEGGDFEDMLEAVKRLPGRRFDSGERAWVIPGTPEQAASSVRPYRVMFLDDDPLSESTPQQVQP